MYKTVSFHKILRHSTGSEITIPDNTVEVIDVTLFIYFSTMYLQSVSCCIESTSLIF